MSRRLAVAIVLLMFGVQSDGRAQSPVAAKELATTVVKFSSVSEQDSYDGVVEAVTQTVVAAQIPGAVVALGVKSGDVVHAGQVLMRIDPRAVEQSAAAGDAQVQSAGASLEIARKDFARQQQLFQKGFISQAGLDRAEAEFKAAQAQVKAQVAQAGVARTQSGFALVTAPYGGVVSDVPVSLGDMAMPGRALLALYDPRAMRVTAAVPESAAAVLANASTRDRTAVRLELPGSGARAWRKPAQIHVLPAADPATHTVTVRFDLQSQAGDDKLAPGMFARVWLPATAGTGAGRAYVPMSSVVHRAELAAVYVVDEQGMPRLRQVRLGRSGVDVVEVLSGLGAGERVAIDPQAAARVR